MVKRIVWWTHLDYLLLGQFALFRKLAELAHVRDEQLRNVLAREGVAGLCLERIPERGDDVRLLLLLLLLSCLGLSGSCLRLLLLLLGLLSLLWLWGLLGLDGLNGRHGGGRGLHNALSTGAG